jgi:hypothetical protein
MTSPSLSLPLLAHRVPENHPLFMPPREFHFRRRRGTHARGTLPNPSCLSSPCGLISLLHRCPIECRLMRGVTWLCRVYLRRSSTSRGANSSELSKERFGDDITDSDSVKERVERAQLAILNPSLPAETFLDDNTDLRAPAELSFSTNIVCLEITGPDYSDISFVDLPGTSPKFRAITY